MWINLIITFETLFVFGATSLCNIYSSNRHHH